MKPFLDSTSAGSRHNHERQKNHLKETGDSVTRCKTYSLGTNVCLPDTNPLVPNSRSPDAVSCWGDVPKRQPRLADLFHASDEDLISSTRSSMTHCNDNAYMGQRTGPDRSVLTESVGSSYKKSQSSYPKSITTASKTAESDESTNSKSNKNPSGTGRERLLEWLRTSQAKRDENNRQVFTRWIDRIDSMNNQESITANLSSAAALTSVAAVNMGTPGTVDFAHNSLFTSAFPGANGTNGTTLPGLIASPAFLIGGPFGMLTAPGLNTINPAHVAKPNTMYPNSLTNQYLSASLTNSKSGSGMNNLAQIATVQPGLVTFSQNTGTNPLETHPHPDTVLSPPGSNESDTTKSEAGSQSVKNLTSNNNNNSNSVRATYGTETSTGVSNCCSTADKVSNTKPVLLKSGLMNPESVSPGTNSVPLNTVYLSSTVPLNAVDPSVVPGSIHPPHYYMPMPVINDPLASQMYYYYYYYYCQNQLANSSAPGTGKPLGIPQPLVCYFPNSGAQPPIPASGQSLYIPDNCMCLPTYPPMVDTNPYELGTRRPDANGEAPMEISTPTTYTPLVPFGPGAVQTTLGSETNQSILLLGLADSESHCLLNTENGVTESSDGSTTHRYNNNNNNNKSTNSNHNGALDFDAKKWYSMLHDIANSHDADSSKETKSTPKTTDPTIQSNSGSPSLGKSPQTANA
ncbi:unnamed protein product [Echinostoma caproni]|uniref:PUM-HD domain-containing protein n=1 Tax=Echinostoma caproni TaxID=27848 RepID=A0A183A2D4_9TREM|nr:unnamed protein product [Echinostoma caproni]